MFKRGDVILAPCRGDDGYELRPHWMVVIQVDQEDGAVYAVFTTSTKEGLSGGQYSFTDTERVLAGFLILLGHKFKTRSAILSRMILLVMTSTRNV